MMRTYVFAPSNNSPFARRSAPAVLVPCRHGFIDFALPRAGFRDLFHPLRIFVVQLIETLVICGSIVKTHQPVFEICAPDEEVRAVWPDANGFPVRSDRRRIVFQIGLYARQNHRPTKITRRIGDRLSVEIEKLLLALIPLCVQRSFSREGLIFWEVVDQLDVLIDASGIVFHPGNCGY